MIRSLPSSFEIAAARRTVSPLEGHALWAATYDDAPNPIIALEERTLEPLLPNLLNKFALDLACGTGRWINVLLRRGASRVVGVDLSAPMLERAASKSGIRGHLVRADCLALPIRSGAIDVAICSFALGYLTTLSGFLDALTQILSPGACFFLADLHPSAYERGWRRSFRVGDAAIDIFSHRYSIEEVCQELSERGLALLNLFEPGFGEPEREIFRSCGKSHVFDAVSGVPAIWVAEFRRSQRSNLE